MAYHQPPATRRPSPSPGRSVRSRKVRRISKDTAHLIQTTYYAMCIAVTICRIIW